LGADKKRKQLALVNYYRNHRFLCRKDEMTLTLREHCERVRLEMGRIAPETYIFKAGEAGRTEVESEMLNLGFWRQKKRGKGTVWIVKPSDGQKGEGIHLVSTQAQLEEAVTGEKRKGAGVSAGTVVQKYVERPLLLTGGRKFDLRCWVLVDWQLNVYVFEAGVLRVTATPYSLTNENGELTLDDLHMHLSNHCIAEKHEDFGKWEPTNELWYEDLDAILLEKFPAQQPTTKSNILPAMEAIIVQTIVASREELVAGCPHRARALCGAGLFEGQPASVDTIGSFNLFGYDFMIADDLQVQLIEVNSSPAVAEELLPELVQQLLKVLIDPVFPPQPEPVAAATASQTEEEEEEDALRQALKAAAISVAKERGEELEEKGGAEAEAAEPAKHSCGSSSRSDTYPCRFRLLTQVRAKTESECRAGGRWAEPLDGRHTIRKKRAKQPVSDWSLDEELANAENCVAAAAATAAAAEGAAKRSAGLLALAKGHATAIIEQSRAATAQPRARSYRNDIGRRESSADATPPTNCAGNELKEMLPRGCDKIVRFSKKGSDNASSAVFTPPTVESYCLTGKDKRGGDKPSFLPTLHSRKVMDESERLEAQEKKDKQERKRQVQLQQRRKAEEQKLEEARKRKQKRRQQVLLRHLMKGVQGGGGGQGEGGNRQHHDSKQQRQQQQQQQQQQEAPKKALSKYKLKLAAARKLKEDHRAIEAEYIARML
jgi:tubulin--tyrosine ligase